MKLFGRLNIDNTNHLIVVDEQKTTHCVYIISELHKDDLRNKVLGRPLEHPVIEDILQLHGKNLDSGYILASMRRTRVSQESIIFGRQDLIEKYIELLSMVNSYSFKNVDIKYNDTFYKDLDKIIRFEAADAGCAMRYTKRDGRYESLQIRSRGAGLNLQPRDIKVRFKLKEADYIKMETILQKKVDIASIKDVTLEDLARKLDLRWLEQKDYRSIETIEEFENEVINDIVLEYHSCIQKGEEFILSLDTETDGLNIYYLDDNNPDKNFIVATPLSWKDHQGVVIFNDMEYFDNVPKEYMFDRLRGLLENCEETVLEIKGKYARQTKEYLVNNYNIDENKLKTKALDLSIALNTDESKYDSSVVLNRRKINLVAHNAPFDGRVLYDNGVTPYWNNDTMQLAFNLNPKVAKGKYNNKLKGLTRRVFGHETPELSDLLGKKNEDKYKYLKDKRLAIVYGCADADYTRLLYKYLRKLISDEAYKIYQTQDMEMLNELYISEYYGMTIAEDEVKELAYKTEHDMHLIHEFLKSYVGRFIEKKNKILELDTLYRMNKITELEFKTEIQHISASKDAKYQFEMKGADYGKIMFEILNYPVITRTEKGAIKTDKKVLKKLQSVKLDTPSRQMSRDLVSEDGKRVLIKADDFNSLKYPVAYVLSLYKNLEKEFTAYFKPVRDTNLEGRLFKNYSLSRIETFRIMNPGQTMKGSLKSMVLPFDGGKEWYMVDFDMAQVEYRIMVSIAGLVAMIERLRDPEKDFHTESAANIYSIPAHTVSKKLRKGCKSINFGIPYGLGDHSLCENIHGKINDKTMYETRKLMDAFKTRNKEVIDMLEYHRDEALKPRHFSKEFKKFCGFIEEVENPDGTIKEVEKPVGWVRNELGRYRLFDLSNLDKSRIGSIRRAAGNFPIQSFAAELFRIILLNFRRRCIKEGIKDKIIWHMLIHDELLLSAHKSINPFFLYKLILEECMVTIDGHTEYFVGINIGSSWADCKDDLAEAPVLFVREMVKRWDAGEFKNDTWIDNPKAYVEVHMKDFIKRRIHDVLAELQPNIDNENINFALIDANLENYTVRAYVGDHFIPQALINNKGKILDKWWGFTDQERFLLSLCTWANRYYGKDKFVELPNGQLVNIEMLGSDESTVKNVSFDIELVEEEPLDIFDDDGEIIDVYEIGLLYDAASYDSDSGNIVELKVSKQQVLEYIKETPRQLIITVPKTKQLELVKNVLKPYADSSGTSVLLKAPNKKERWCRISKDVNLYDLDEKIKQEVS